MAGSKIADIRGRRIWDSRGNPTLEVEVTTANGVIGRGIAPAGASRGAREALDLRDGGTRLGGLDVQKALACLREIVNPSVTGLDATDQKSVDAAIVDLDPTPAKAILGGNVTVAVSLAALDAGARSRGLPKWLHVSEIYATTPSVPLPEIQIFGGGAHAGRRVDVQDFMIMVPGATSFEEVMEVSHEIYRAAGSIMKERGRLAGVADEGGWWPEFTANEEALEILVAAMEKAGEKPGDRVVISLDIAASTFGSNGKYVLALEDRQISSGQLISMLGEWLGRYPIASIEDPLGEDDREGMQAFTKEFGKRVQIIGDDYLVTSARLVDEAARDRACNAVLVKVNQVGTVSEAVETLEAAREFGWQTVVSARSGETEDVTISHLAVGLGAGQLKVGSFARSERMAKWNECLRIAEAPGGPAFVGAKPLANTWWWQANSGEPT